MISGLRPPATHSLFGRRLGWLGRLATPLARRPSPFSRLDFYKVGHGLTWKLRLYTGRDRVDLFRGVPWGTLTYWALLMEGTVEDVAYAYALTE